MRTLPGRFGGLRALELFFPRDAGEVLEQVESAPVVLVRQCDAPTADALASRAFRRKPTPSLQIDLSQDEDALRRGLHPKACRRRVERAERLGAWFTVGERTDDARGLIAAHVARSRYSQPIDDDKWELLLQHCDVFVAGLEGRALAAHLFFVDGGRARMHLSATAERSSVEDDHAIGYANRFLHWSEMLHYKQRGVVVYDLGGVDVDPAAPLYSIGQFKLSFGGQIVPEESVYLANGPALRGALRVGSKGRLVLKRALGRA